MPRAVLSNDEKEKALAAASADLKYLLSRQDVSGENQELFYHHGITTIEKFANAAKDKTDLAQMLKDHWDLDPDRSLNERVQVASIMCAFGNATTRSQRAAEVEAEYDSKEWIKPVVAGEWQAMRMALEKRIGKVEEKTMPAKEYVEKKLSELEAGEFRAETLAEVISREEVDPDSMIPVWDSKGNISLRRGSTKIKDPSNAESLRRRLTVLKHCYIMIGLRRTNRAEWQGEIGEVVEQYKDYLLGDYCHGLVATDEDGNTIAAPPWPLVLKYELAVRKYAAKLMADEQRSFCVALKMAWRDPTTKERHFTTPLALYCKRPAAQQKQPQFPAAAPSKGKGKNKPGGKAKVGQCASHTPGGEPICFRFNTKNERCKQAKCRFKHVCGLCFSDKHPMFACNSQVKQDLPKDTQGKGA